VHPGFFTLLSLERGHQFVFSVGEGGLSLNEMQSMRELKGDLPFNYLALS